MDWTSVATWLFFGGWSCIGLYVASTIKELGESVKQLNVNVAIIITQINDHDHRISRLEDAD